MSAIATMLAAVTGVQAVTVGAPESFTNKVSAYVTVGGQRISDRHAAGGDLSGMEREQDYWCAFGYRVKGAEADAETTIAAALDDLARDFYTARKAETGLFATATTQVVRGSLDLSLASAPDYQIVAGQEYRVYPFLITVVQLGG